MEDEESSVKLETRPTCALTQQWKRREADESVTIRYAGADGYLYERRWDGWFRVGRNVS